MMQGIISLTLSGCHFRYLLKGDKQFLKNQNVKLPGFGSCEAGRDFLKIKEAALVGRPP